MTELSPGEAVYFAAVALPPAERAAYLDRACAGRDDLRRRVEQMLAARDQVGDFLEPPAAAPAVNTADFPGREETVGAIIGRQVQADRGDRRRRHGQPSTWPSSGSRSSGPSPSRSSRPGMDSKAVLGRFEAERQALAMMDHPNIARVLDAGTTDGGRPFFVMELVKGVPITQYCDEQKLTPRQRLELFVPVCHAIQHAHQKGVIHRDIKPSNVLVALYDDRPVPKVIDFGVAKAAGQAAHRPDAHDRVRGRGRHAGIHEPGAGQPEQPGHRHPQRRLFPRRAALRAAHRQHAGGPPQSRPGGAAGGVADRAGRRGPAAERPAEHDRRAAAGGRQPRHRAGQVVQADEGRTRLDRAQGPGEGPGPPVRDGQRHRRGRPAVPGERAGRGPAAEHGLPAPERPGSGTGSRSPPAGRSPRR